MNYYVAYLCYFLASNFQLDPLWVFTLAPVGMTCTRAVAGKGMYG